MYKKIIAILIVILVIPYSVFATEEVTADVAQEMDLDDLIGTLEEYAGDSIDINEMTDDLINGETIDYGVIGNFVLNKLFYEIKVGIKFGITILIVIVIMAIIKGIELEKDNSLANVADLVGFIIIVGIILKSYAVITKMFIETISLLTQIVEVVSPFMLAIMIASGEITTSGVIGPVILFVTSLVGVVVTYVIIPLLSISLIFKIVGNMSNGLKLDGFSKLFSSASMWVVSVIFALFLGVLELQSAVTTSVDSVTVKTTQAAVSNLIPVVGKFVSDSLEVVMGASEVIGKSVGVVGIVVLVIVSIVPIIKLVIYSLIYFIVSCFAEMLSADSKIVKLVGDMSKQYKTMIGIMTGVSVTFIIAIAIVINLMGKVAS